MADQSLHPYQTDIIQWHVHEGLSLEDITTRLSKKGIPSTIITLVDHMAQWNRRSSSLVVENSSQSSSQSDRQALTPDPEETLRQPQVANAYQVINPQKLSRLPSSSAVVEMQGQGLKCHQPFHLPDTESTEETMERRAHCYNHLHRTVSESLTKAGVSAPDASPLEQVNLLHLAAIEIDPDEVVDVDSSTVEGKDHLRHELARKKLADRKSWGIKYPEGGPRVEKRKRRRGRQENKNAKSQRQEKTV